MTTTSKEPIPYQSGMLDNLDNRIDKELRISTQFEQRVFQILGGIPLLGKLFKDKIRGILLKRLENK